MYPTTDHFHSVYVYKLICDSSIIHRCVNRYSIASTPTCSNSHRKYVFSFPNVFLFLCDDLWDLESTKKYVNHIISSFQYIFVSHICTFACVWGIRSRTRLHNISFSVTCLGSEGSQARQDDYPHLFRLTEIIIPMCIHSHMCSIFCMFAFKI